MSIGTSLAAQLRNYGILTFIVITAIMVVSLALGPSRSNGESDSLRDKAGLTELPLSMRILIILVASVVCVVAATKLATK
jgi:hypothetical protein